MTAFVNPTLAAFVGQLSGELAFAQVQIRQEAEGFTLRHIEDAGAPGESLRAIGIEDLRLLVQTTVTDAFRPLKSAPNLRRGWRAHAADTVQLGIALDHLYPGAIADWFAAQARTPQVTHYREFTARQTGMYRITTLPDDYRAAQITRACCDRRFCLKQRLWTVPGLDTDVVADKSLIPCLEPCALMMEFVRKAVRLEKEGELSAAISPEEVRRLQEKLDRPVSSIREADFESAENPRRLLLLQQLARRD